MIMCMPLLSSITLILILGNISFPGTINFVAEFSSLLSATKYSIFVGVFALEFSSEQSIPFLCTIKFISVPSLTLHTKPEI